MFSKRFALCLVLVVILSQAGCQFRGAPKATPTARLAASAENTTLHPTTHPSPFPTQMPELKPSATPLPALASVPTCQNAPNPASSAPAISNPAGALQSDPAGSGLAIVGQIGGPTRAVATAEGYALVGVGPRLTVLDISDVEAICEMGSTQPFGAPVRGIAISGDVAYVAAGEAGLYIIDTSDPAQPVVTGNYDSPGYAEGVSVVDKVVYLADGPYGLRIVDVTDGAQPVEISAVYELSYAFDVAVDSGYAYVAAAGAGVLVADISDTTYPTEAGGYDTPGYVYSVTASGATLFVADGWEGVQVVDISQPDQPSTIASFKTAGWAMDVAALGEILYVADASGGLRLVNISDRTKPTEVGSYQASFGHAAQVAVRGQTAYVADIRQGVHIVDVSTPAKPERVGLYSPMGFTQAVAVAGEYAYATALGAGFRVIDLTDPTRPQEVAAALEGITLASVALSGTAAYATTSIGGTYTAPGWYTIDITDPLHPLPSPEKSFDRASRGVFVQGTTAYYAAEWGLWLADLSDPLEPRELSLLQTTETTFEGAVAAGVAVADDTAYLAVSEKGLYIVDVSDPRHPAIVGVFDQPAVLESGEKNPKGVNIYGVVVAPPFAYILDNDLLRVLDISVPTQPKALGSLSVGVTGFNVVGPAQWLALDGNRLFIAAGAAGLLELDVSDPAEPRLAAELRLPGIASWVVADGEYVYVADGEGGLFIIEPGRVSASTSRVRTVWQASPFTGSGNASLGGISSLVEGIASDYQFGMQTSEVELPTYQLAAFRSQASPIVVTSAANSGPGTLREALTRAVSGDAITFDAEVFEPDAPVTISLESQLPPLTQGRITIDASNAGVILDGSKTLDASSGLTIQSNNNVVMGLQILHFPRNGIDIGGSNNTIGGDRSRGKGPLGEGNLISGNKEQGIMLCCGENVSDNRIVGNYIGTDLTGMKPLGNGVMGITGETFRNIIGSLTPGEGNVISGNGTREIYFKLSSGNLIIGNIIGLDASGQNPLSPPGSPWSVDLESSTSHTRIQGNVIAWGILIIDVGSYYNEIVGNYIGTDATGTVSLGDGANVGVNLPFNRIGGTRPGEGNVINGAVWIQGASDVVVLGNLIGVDATGKQAFTTRGRRVSLVGADHNFIGGPTEAERNVIAGEGILVDLYNASDYNFIAGNYLGTDASEAEVFPNGAKMGIWIEIAEHNAIQGNLIAGSQEVGVGLAIKWDRPVANFNVLRTNQITQNPKLGIAVGGGMDNTIVANIVTENGQNASDGGRDNHWDDGSEGNYWGDYQGVDRDGDGIGDIPYEVTPNGVDHFPLMQPTLSKYSPN